MLERLKFILSQLREQLWVRPLAMCLISVLAVFAAKLAERFDFLRLAPEINVDTIEDLLKIVASSMLVIAVFAVGSMVSSYASASRTATPRSLPLVISDDASQNALSGFIGAFIFSIVAFIAVKAGFHEPAGNFVLFCMTLVVLAGVILIFLRWVDRIARLGKLGSTIEKVEDATASAIKKRRDSMKLGGCPAGKWKGDHKDIELKRSGYVQYIDVEAIQEWAEENETRVELLILPGTFSQPGRHAARVFAKRGDSHPRDTEELEKSFVVGRARTFEDDPRFGLVALSEIAIRALSPAVNDPGTAIHVIGSFVRLFELWNSSPKDREAEVRYDRVAVPEIETSDMFDDAFLALARDGAAYFEVGVKLQKALCALATLPDRGIRQAALRCSKLAIVRAEKALDMSDDLEAVRTAAPKDD